MRDYLDVPFEVKAVSDDGLFSGYGSVFGVLDSYKEVVAPGAFAESLQGRMPALLWQLDTLLGHFGTIELIWNLDKQPGAITH